LAALLMGAVGAACGPSEAELDARARQIAEDILATQTAAVPTITPTFTPPPPTITPSPTITPTPTPSCLIPPDGLVSWWSGEGDTADIVGGNDGSVAGGAAFDAGMVGQAFSLGGAPLSLSAQPPLAEGFTIEFWVNFEEGPFFQNFQSLFNNNKVFIRKEGSRDGNKFNIFVTLTDGSVEPRAHSTTATRPGTWTHIAGTWSKTALRLYVNGQTVGVSLRPGVLTGSAVRAQFGMGEQSSSSQHPFLGRLDELSIYERALSTQEIQAIFEAGEAGKCQPDI
jgi:hypothetical protein